MMITIAEKMKKALGYLTSFASYLPLNDLNIRLGETSPPIAKICCPVPRDFWPINGTFVIITDLFPVLWMILLGLIPIVSVATSANPSTSLTGIIP